MAQKAGTQAGNSLFFRLKQAFQTEKGGKETASPELVAVQVQALTETGEERHARHEQPERGTRLLALTRRERELLLLLLDGCTLKEAAGALSVQYSTANTHMTSLYKKLGVNSRPELIIQYRELCIKSDRKQ